MNKYRLYNNIFGWTAFIIAAAVYLLTMESTASFWDCGEFIAASYKQMVGHPPGAPFFMVLGRFFTLFAGGNKEMVPLMINAMSALASAFSILFLFWSVTHLARKMLIKNEEDHSLVNYIIVFGSGLVGALAYTFSDTFWFSAVEGEVYATSSLFTAFVFWAILKWEESADDKHANRWLVLIAYLMGLSIGVHLLNLLAIPAIVFVYYFKKYPVTRWGIVIAGLVSVVLLGTVMYGIIQGAIKIASWFELLFVNGLGLPFNTGLYFYLIAIAAGLGYGIWYTYKKENALWNTVLACIAVLLIGYSSYTMIMIRSNAKPPMNQNAPDNLFSLIYYLNREQYGDRPLLYGQNYNSPIVDLKEVSPIYAPVNGRYEIVSHKQEYTYNQRSLTVFPRMHSNERDHVKAYESWIDIKGSPLSVPQEDGKEKIIRIPTLKDNIAFFFRYQIGFMYLRYFMWNFAGRQNDIQGAGELNKGNWISGIPFIDDARLGPQDKLPDHLKNNRAGNKFFLLPLILGLIGLFYQYSKSKRDFTVVMLLFIMTGLAIVVYLNQTPYQPRERDYAYAGSFYAFTIWIGLGVAALMDFLKKGKNVVTASVVTAGCLFLVPGIMAKENWNDHDRSGRYTSRDLAYDYLNSCEKNGILFTNGDNDTFPLWYVQEVEGVRPDVRVVNLSYLSAEWYISQMRMKAYESEGVPSTFKPEEYAQGQNDVVYLVDRSKEYVPLADAINFIKSTDPRKYQNMGHTQNYLPTTRLSLAINPADVLASGTVDSSRKDQILPVMQWQIKRQYITKSDLMILDMLLANNWKRPMYFAVTVSRENYQGLENYFVNCGLAYRIVPMLSRGSELSSGGVDSKVMYDNLMNKFRWGNVADPHVYLDENNVRMFSNMRIYFSDLASALIQEGKMDSARKVVNRCLEIVPSDKVPQNYFTIPLIRNLYQLNEIEKADQMVKQISDNTMQEITYAQKIPRSFYTSGNNRKRMGYKAIMGDQQEGNYVQGDIQLNLYIANELIRITGFFGRTDLNKDLTQRFMPYLGNAAGQQ